MTDKKAATPRGHESHGNSEGKGNPRGTDGAKAIVIDPPVTGDSDPKEGKKTPRY